jgi:hypothetical protein
MSVENLKNISLFYQPRCMVEGSGGKGGKGSREGERKVLL